MFERPWSDRHLTTVLRCGGARSTAESRNFSGGRGEHPTKMAAHYIDERNEFIREFLAFEGVDFDRACRPHRKGPIEQRVT
ncbi:hypothetical protein MRX96_024619 [Rhipicephalus microplus]